MKEKHFQLKTWHSTFKFITDSKVSYTFFHNKVMWTQSLWPLVTSAYTQVSWTITKSHDHNHNLTTPQLNNTQRYGGMECVLMHLLLLRPRLNLQTWMHFLHWLTMGKCVKCSGTKMLHIIFFGSLPVHCTMATKMKCYISLLSKQKYT